MFKVMVREARPGMKLARPIFHPVIEDQIVLARGATLNVDDIAHLHELGVYDLWVSYPGLEMVDRLVSPETAAAHPRLVEMLRRSVAPTGIDGGASSLERDEAIHDLVLVVEAAAARPVLSAALYAISDDLLSHSLSVSYLALLLGRRLNGYLVEQRPRLVGSRAKEVLSLGLGCLLHDIGEVTLPESGRESRRQPHDPDTTWQNHAEIGYEMMHGQIEPSAATVILHHHQHFDGTGFPTAAHGVAQRGEQIHIFARIAAAADVFLHLLRADGIAAPIAQAWAKVQQPPYAPRLDPVVLAALLEIATPFAPGMLVTLSDGRGAIVAQTNTQSPSLPSVRVLTVAADDTPEPAHRPLLDLSRTPHLSIKSMDGINIANAPDPAETTAAQAWRTQQEQLVMV